ncbi:hypothetical protein F2P45_00990 [Massilia sp. CCM 8733]|uniref:Transcriptional regulator n=1 Tax=Massilia mucilaginosa TaxID=2609282 RepID=A0ABX0NLC9_9BURK|nr:hypothetical protein [Massilia mucilaginosa]NHZ87615.1 hypothetical protein [Massilia mucilaginosa]
MYSKIADDERVNFSDRLKSALLASKLPIQAGPFARAFNLRAAGSAVTPHAARKWLAGEAIPTHEKILILASWLGVHAAWLRYGDAENAELPVPTIPEALLATADLALLKDILSLPASTQQLVREIVDAFLRDQRGATLRSDKRGARQ